MFGERHLGVSKKKINFVLNGFQPFLLPESFLLWLSAHSATVDKISMEFDELITYVTGGSICGDWSGTSLGYKVVYPCLNFLQAGPQHTTHRYQVHKLQVTFHSNSTRLALTGILSHY